MQDLKASAYVVLFLCFFKFQKYLLMADILCAIQQFVQAHALILALPLALLHVQGTILNYMEIKGHNCFQFNSIVFYFKNS